jgi:hypothetical protein
MRSGPPVATVRPPLGVVKDNGGPALTTPLACELPLQVPEAERPAQEQQRARIEPRGMAAATAQHPQEVPAIDRVAKGPERFVPAPHENILGTFDWAGKTETQGGVRSAANQNASKRLAQ